MSPSSSFLYNIPTYNPGDLTTKKGLRRGLGQQYGVNTGLMQQQQGQRGAEWGSLFPGYNSMAIGGNPEENNALEQSILTPLRGAFNTARDTAANRLARTRNSAGYGSLLGELSREEGRQSSAAGFDIANEKFRRKMAGLEGLARLYGIDASFLGELGNQQNALLGIGNSVQSRSRGLLGTIGAVQGLFQ